MSESLKLFVTSMFKDRPNEHFSTCGYTTHAFWKQSVLKYGKVEAADVDDCDIICIFVTFLTKDFKFDDELGNKIVKSKKPIVIFDYSEYGGHSEDHLDQYNIHGFKVEYVGLLVGEYSKLHDYLKENRGQIKCYFKRELSVKNDLSKVPFKVFPLEFVGDVYSKNDDPDTPDQYYDRPCIFNFIWGFSNVSRPFLHGEFLKKLSHFNCIYACSYRQVIKILENKIPSNKFIFLVNHDWYERISSDELMALQKLSHVVLDLYGCGLKCFRNVESTANCLSFKQNPSKLVWTYQWEHGVNTVFLPTREGSNIIDEVKSIEIILDFWHGKRHLLYPMYLKSMEMNHLYAPKNYVPNHIIKSIVNSIK